jgi:iron-sulfur cluster repair protein YtfE (RIC family)
MRRHDSLIPLSHDHHHGLVLAQLIKSDAPAYKKLPKTLESKVEYTKNFYENDLKYHFYEEEKILYPSIKNKNKELEKLFKEIFREHSEITSLIYSLTSSDKQEEILNKLGLLLESHIRKEERKLFPAVQKFLTLDELDGLNEKISDSRKKKSKTRLTPLLFNKISEGKNGK